MKRLLVLIAALLATGCTTSGRHNAAAEYCEQGHPAYDAQRCFNYWTAVNRNVLG